ncbi:MAG: Carbohydrate family 9 binding domain-like, partial [Gemmatimonadota bacterium]
MSGERARQQERCRFQGRVRSHVWWLATLFACLVSGPAFADEMVGPIALLEELDGIPVNRINVETRAHEAVGIVVDGHVDEAVWASLPTYDNMLVAVPARGTPGRYSTHVRFLATEQGLYVSAVMEQPPDTFVVR